MPLSLEYGRVGMECLPRAVQRTRYSHCTPVKGLVKANVVALRIQEMACGHKQDYCYRFHFW